MGVRKGLNSLEVIGKEISVDNRLWKHYPTELLPLSDFPIFICVTLQTTKDNLCFRVIFSYFIFIIFDFFSCLYSDFFCFKRLIWNADACIGASPPVPDGQSVV